MKGYIDSTDPEHATLVEKRFKSDKIAT
jgi:hypothetical protein